MNRHVMEKRVANFPGEEEKDEENITKRDLCELDSTSRFSDGAMCWASLLQAWGRDAAQSRDVTHD